MCKNHVYIILSIALNILICFIGFWTLLLGLIGINGLFTKPPVQDIVIGTLIYIGTYLIAVLLNFLLYKIFKKKAQLNKKYFLIPSGSVVLIGVIFTIVLFL